MRQLIRAYVSYGRMMRVKAGGEKFLADFPHAEERMEVALDVADADARAKDTKDEFAIYDMLAWRSGAAFAGHAADGGGDVAMRVPRWTMQPARPRAERRR